MDDSILDNIKKLLGLDSSDDSFDTDIVILINNALSTLYQIGVGPDTGFMISDNKTTWKEYIGDEQDWNRFNSIVTYIYLKVKMIFDPPSSSSVADSFKSSISELEFRLGSEAERKPIGGA